MHDRYKLVELCVNHIPQIVHIHIAALPGDVLPNLGVATLRKYYRSVLSSPAQGILGVLVEEKLVGICHISLKPINLGIALNFRMIAGVLSLMVRNYRVLISGVLQACKFSKISSTAAEIFLIAVYPEYQKQGIGRILIGSAMNYCHNNNREYLVTKTSNKRLKKFYVSNYEAEEIDSFKIFDSVYSILRWNVSHQLKNQNAKN